MMEAVYTAVYYQPYKGEHYPITITFTERALTLERINEDASFRGHGPGQVVWNFQAEFFTNSTHNKLRLIEFLRTEMYKQRDERKKQKQESKLTNA